MPAFTVRTRVPADVFITIVWPGPTVPRSTLVAAFAGEADASTAAMLTAAARASTRAVGTRAWLSIVSLSSVASERNDGRSGNPKPGQAPRKALVKSSHFRHR